LVAFLIRLKQRLQFTGWLQYIPLLVWAGLFGLLGLLCWFLSLSTVMSVFLSLSGLFVALFVFDVVTLKWGIRPKESLPPRRDDLNAFDLMRARRSCRSFQDRLLTDKDREELLGYVKEYSEAPYGGALGKAPIRFAYVEAPLTVWPVVGAREFLVAIAPKEYNRLSVVDVGRALQHIVHKATKMGLGTCWIGPGADHKSAIAALGERFDAEQDHIICFCAIGYASFLMPFFIRTIVGIVQRRRKPLSDLFFLGETLKQPLDTTSAPFDQLGRTYEVCQWAPSSFNAQPTRCAAIMDEAGETIVRFDFFATTASRYYAPVALGIWCTQWELGCEALGIQGHFEILSSEERGGAAQVVSVQERQAHYDISWLPNTPL